jgi:hypothetical protein
MPEFLRKSSGRRRLLHQRVRVLRGPVLANNSPLDTLKPRGTPQLRVYQSDRILREPQSPGLDLLTHRLEVPFHSIHANRDGIDQRKGLRMLCQDRRKHACDNVSDTQRLSSQICSSRCYGSRFHALTGSEVRREFIARNRALPDPRVPSDLDLAFGSRTRRPRIPGHWPTCRY